MLLALGYWVYALPIQWVHQLPRGIAMIYTTTSNENLSDCIVKGCDLQCPSLLAPDEIEAEISVLALKSRSRQLANPWDTTFCYAGLNL